MKRYLWILLGAPAMLAAQSSNGLGTPTLGYLFDAPSGSLQAIEGVPGAAVLGETLHLDQAYDAIAVAPSRRYALATRSDSSNLFLVKLDGRSGAATRSGIASGRVFFSPSGFAAAIARDGQVEIWTGLPDAPALLRTETVEQSIDKAFVSDNGRELAILSGDSLYRTGEEAALLATQVTDAQFLRGGQDLAALTNAELLLFRKADKENRESLMKIEGGRVMAMSRDENSVAVLGEGIVTWFDRTSQASAAMPVEASLLARAEGNAVFQLSDENGAVWILDSDTGATRLLKVEAINTERAAQ